MYNHASVVAFQLRHVPNLHDSIIGITPHTRPSKWENPSRTIHQSTISAHSQYNWVWKQNALWTPLILSVSSIKYSLLVTLGSHTCMIERETG